jgi:hypothetical protein
MAYNGREERAMADIDPYVGIETDEERQAVYERLLEQYQKEEAEYQRAQAKRAQVESVRQKEVYNLFKYDWDHYRKVQLHEDDQFNRYIAMFAAGAFGVSFAFINDIVPFKTAAHKDILVTAWACFAATLLVNVVLHRISSAIHKKYCNMISENIQRSYDGEPPLPYKRWYTGWVMAVLYWLDAICFMGGMTCLIVFVFLNT